MKPTWRYLPAILWVGAALVGAYFGISLISSMAGVETLADGTPRSMVDKAFPYLFLLLTPYGLWRAWAEFRAAQSDIPVADAAAERTRVQQKRQQEAAVRYRDAPPVTQSTEDQLKATLATLRRHGVLGKDEVDDAAFVALAQSLWIESGDLYEASSVLAIYAEAYGPLVNLFAIPDQIEVPDESIEEMVAGFARLADRAVEIEGIRSDTGPGTVTSEVRLTLDGNPHVVPFQRHVKNAPGTLIDGLAQLLDPTPPFAVAYFDSVYLVTRLPEDARHALNAEIDRAIETFERLPAQST